MSTDGWALLIAGLAFGAAVVSALYAGQQVRESKRANEREENRWRDAREKDVQFQIAVEPEGPDECNLKIRNVGFRAACLYAADFDQSGTKRRVALGQQTVSPHGEHFLILGGRDARITQGSTVKISWSLQAGSDEIRSWGPVQLKDWEWE